MSIGCCELCVAAFIKDTESADYGRTQATEIYARQQALAGAQTLLFEKNFEGEVDEGIEWLITLFRLIAVGMGRRHLRSIFLHLFTIAGRRPRCLRKL
jgi:hypothetical protein